MKLLFSQRQALARFLEAWLKEHRANTGSANLIAALSHFDLLNQERCAEIIKPPILRGKKGSA